MSSFFFRRLMVRRPLASLAFWTSLEMSELELEGRTRLRKSHSRSNFLDTHQWYHVNFAIDRLTRKVQFKAQAKIAGIGEAPLLFQQEKTLADVPLIASSKPLVIASDSIDTIVAQHPRRSATFNGKIDGFSLKTVSNGRVKTMLDYDFLLISQVTKSTMSRANIATALL